MASAKNVLLVDDYLSVARGLGRLIKLAGHFVTIAANARLALEFMAEVEFDLLITDLDMPGENGIWLLEQVQATQPRVFRVLSSGSLTDLAHHVRSGLVQYLLAKPVEAAHLRELLLTSQSPVTDS